MIITLAISYNCQKNNCAEEQLYLLQSSDVHHWLASQAWDSARNCNKFLEPLQIVKRKLVKNATKTKITIQMW
jgi:hypothetical protein